VDDFCGAAFGLGLGGAGLAALGLGFGFRELASMSVALMIAGGSTCASIVRASLSPCQRRSRARITRPCSSRVAAAGKSVS
jgi:hypothetical protein